MKNDVVLINFIILGGGVWGYAPPGKFFNISTSETVSGGFWWLLSTQMGKVCQQHPLVPLYFKSNVVRMWDMSPTARSAKL